MRAEILVLAAKLTEDAFQRLFHFESAMVGPDGDLPVNLVTGRLDSFEPDVAFAREVGGKRSNERFFADPYR